MATMIAVTRATTATEIVAYARYSGVLLAVSGRKKDLRTFGRKSPNIENFIKLLLLIANELLVSEMQINGGHQENSWGPGGGGHLGQFLLGMCRWPLRGPTLLYIVYFLANYRSHLSHPNIDTSVY